MHRLRAVGRDAEGFAGRHERRPQPLAVLRRHVDLEAQLAAEADAEHPRWQAGHHPLPHLHEGKRGFVYGDVRAERGQHGPRLGAGQCCRGPVVRNGNQMDVQLRPFRLPPQFQPGQHGFRVAGGGVHQVAVFGNTRRHAIVEDGAVLAQHQPVAAAANGEAAERAGVHAMQKLPRIPPLDVDLAKRGGIEHPHALAHRKALAVHRVLHGFAVARVVPRPKPAANVLPLRPVASVPSVHRRAPFGVEQIVHVPPRHRAEGHWRVGRAEHGGTCCFHALAQRVGKDGDAVHVAELALVRAEAKRRVALHVLHRAVAFAGGELDVRSRHVQLHVHELPRRPARRVAVGHQEQGLRGLLWRFVRAEVRCLGLAISVAGGSCGRGTSLRPLAQNVLERAGAGGCAGQPTTLARRLSQESQHRGFPNGLRPGLGSQMDGRIPAAGGGHQIAPEAPWRTGDVAFAVERHGKRTANAAPAAARFHQAVAGQDCDARGLGLLHQSAGGRGSRIQHSHHLPAQPLPQQRCAIGVVVGGGQQQPLAGRYGIAARVGRHRGGQHHARQIVAGEHQRSLHSARRQHRFLGANTVQPQPRRRVARAVVQPFESGEEVVIVIAEHRAAWQQRGGRVREGSHHRFDPSGPRRAINSVLAVQQAAAEGRLLVRQDHPRPRRDRLPRRRQARRPAAHHQHVAVLIDLVVARAAGRQTRPPSGRHPAKACFLPQHALGRPPQRIGRQERLVVKASRQQSRRHAEATLG